MARICVIGAGIMGYSAAVNVQMALPGATITIVADEFGQQLVSYGAGGLYRPDLEHICKGDNDENNMMKQCLRDSWDHFSHLATSPLSRESGNFLVSGMLSHRTPMDNRYAMIRECTYDFRQMSDSEARQRGIPDDFKYNYFYTSVITQPYKYIPWMKKQFEAKGGRTQTRTVRNLEELHGEFDLVINCCGLRALTFLQDSQCFPTRGQLVRVKAPWLKHFHYFDTDTYIIPHEDKLNIGGIRIHGDGNTEVDPEVTKTIMKNAEAMYPRLKGAEILNVWAASRPGRSSPRIELETLKLEHNKQLPVIHNYGHGGHGVTLSWGCGVQVAGMAKTALQTLVPKAAL